MSPRSAPKKARKKRDPSPSSSGSGKREKSAAAESAGEQLRGKFEQLRVQVREEFQDLRAGIEKLEAKEGG